jgi:multidrug resistance efflux pump
MNHLKHRSILYITLILVIVIGGGWWLQVRAAPVDNNRVIEATGVIESHKVALASEIGGQVVEVLVEEGQRVEANQPLIRLDDSLLQKQREQAQSQLDAAQATLRMLETGATQDQINAAEAQVSQAQANLQLAQAALDIASAGTRPEVITAYRAQLDQARALYNSMTIILTDGQLNELESALTQAKDNLARAARRRDTLKNNHSIPDYVTTFAESAVTDAQSALDSTRQAYDAAQNGTIPYYRQIELARITWQQAQLNEAQAQARLDGLRSDSKVPNEAIDDAESTLDDAKDLVDAAKSAYDELTSGASAKRLDSAWTEIEKAQRQLASIAGSSGISAEILLAQVDAATSQHHVAYANLSALKNGARDEEIEAAWAQVEAAQAKLDALDIQLKKLTILAPWDGVVLTRNAEVGGMAMPGGTLIEIGRLEQLELTVYLPPEKFGLIVPGQAVQVSADAYPNRVFDGTVLRMADEAEFTPTNVQTKEDRTRLVYAVVISLDNPDLLLKPGMIADVEFAMGEAK